MPPQLEGSTPRRVKVYLLDGEDWIDNGTGYCVGEVDSESKKPYFLVRSETDHDNIILKLYLEGSTQYQRQQETLIVWTDDLGKDFALSFQETDACADLCEFIIRIQQENYAPDILLYYVMAAPHAVGSIVDGDYQLPPQGGEITELITGPINYPGDPKIIKNLPLILEAALQGLNLHYTRSSMQKYILDQDYLSKLIEVFKILEENHDLPSLHLICEIVKTFVLYNESGILEDFVSTRNKLYGLLGILEYDNDYPALKTCYRDYLDDKLKFKVVLKLDNPDILEAMRKDFHLTFLKDVVLARFLDDQTFNLVLSLIFFNQVEIISRLKNESDFIRRVFQMYDDDELGFDNKISLESSEISISPKDIKIEETVQPNKNENFNDTTPDLATKRDGVRMIHQHTNIAKSLQSFQKSEFFEMLVKNGLFKMVSFALNDEEVEIRSLATEVIVIILEQDLSLVNSIHQGENEIYNEPIDEVDVVVENEQIDQKVDQESDKEDAKNSNGDHDDIPNYSGINGNIEIGQVEENKENLDENNTNGTPTIRSNSLHLRLLDDMTLMQILTRLLLEEKVPGLKMQAFEALKILLDSNIALTSNSPRGNELELGLKGKEEDFADVNTSNYFQAFYEKVAPNLFASLISGAHAPANGKICRKDDQLLIQHLLELVSFCTKEHSPEILKFFFLENDILTGVGEIIERENTKTVLKIAAIRCIKNIILLIDDQYTDYLIQKDILGFVFRYFVTLISENNLANSLCLELLDLIVKNWRFDPQNFKKLGQYIVSNYRDVLEQITYVSVGTDVIELTESVDACSSLTPLEPTADLDTDVEKTEELDRREKRQFEETEETMLGKTKWIKSED